MVRGWWSAIVLSFSSFAMVRGWWSAIVLSFAVVRGWWSAIVLSCWWSILHEFFRRTLSRSFRGKKIEIHTVSNNIHFTSIFVKNQYLSMIKSPVEATSVMASHQLTFSRVSDYNKTPTTKTPKKNKVAPALRARLNLSSESAASFFHSENTSCMLVHKSLTAFCLQCQLYRYSQI